MKHFLLSLLLFFCLAVKAQQWGEYTLYSVQNSNIVYLIDTNNTVFKSWTFPTADRTGYSTYLLPGGSVIRAVAKGGNSFTGGPICGKVQKADWSGSITWEFIYSTTAYCSHHDICPMPNGNVLLIAYESKTAAEVTAAGCTQNIIMWPDKIVEVKPTGPNTGDVVWEWHAWDHLMQNVDNTKSNYQSSLVNHPELLNINYKTTKDWMHVNGVNYNAELDQIVISSHNLNEIYVIDHSTTTAEAASHSGGKAGKGGDILYRWGNPAAYGASGTAVINVVHDAHWVPKGCPREGYLVGFNNHGISTLQSCVDMVNPPLNGLNYTITPGSAYGPASYTKRYSCNGHTNNMGGSQQLPNGNTLITVALSGLIYEIDSNGTMLWSKTASGSVSKSFRYTSCYIFGAPDTPTIAVNGKVLTSSDTVGNQWYLNGVAIPGATGKTYTAVQTGNYQVKAMRSFNCESVLSSAVSIDLTGIDRQGNNSGVCLFPNPGSGKLQITAAGLMLTGSRIQVTDLTGKTVYSETFGEYIDLGFLGSGMYYISIVLPEGILTTQKISILK